MFIVRPTNAQLTQSNLIEIAPIYQEYLAYTKGSAVTLVHISADGTRHEIYGFVAKKNILANDTLSNPVFATPWFEKNNPGKHSEKYWSLVKGIGSQYWVSTGTYSANAFVIDDDHNIYQAIADTAAGSKPSETYTGTAAKWRKIRVTNSYAMFDDMGLTKTTGTVATDSDGNTINKIEVTLDSSKCDTCCGFNTKAKKVNWKLLSTVNTACFNYFTPNTGNASFTILPNTQNLFDDSQDFADAYYYTLTKLSVATQVSFNSPSPSIANKAVPTDCTGGSSIKRSTKIQNGVKYFVSIVVEDEKAADATLKCKYVMIKTSGGLQAKSCVYNLADTTVFTSGVGGGILSGVGYGPDYIENLKLLTLPVDSVSGSDGVVELIFLKDNTTETVPISDRFSVYVSKFSLQEDNVSDSVPEAGQYVEIKRPDRVDLPMTGTIVSYTAPTLSVNITNKSTLTAAWNKWEIAFNGQYAQGSISLSNNSTTSWSDYFFNQREYGDSCFYFKFPLLFRSKLQISIEHSDSAECGRFIIGKREQLGSTQTDVAYTIENYSRIITDDFGYTYISEGAYKTKIPLKIYLERKAIVPVTKALTSLRASPAAFIADNSELHDSEYEILYVYGLVKDFEMVIPGATMTLYSLDVESLI